jgi:hypothetical protein
MRAMSTAVRLRRDSGVGTISAICIYDFVESHEIETRFCDLPSLEGMYSASPGPLILLSSERPEGRRTFTCAHEFGHHVFGHGMRVDTEGVGLYSDNDEEFLVDCFAGFLLMPNVSIRHAYICRGWNLSAPSAIQVFTIASYFGVGYSTLIHHMTNGLGLLDRTAAQGLLGVQPKDIRRQLTGRIDSNLVVVDNHWNDRPIDVQVGDVVHLPMNAEIEGSCAYLLSTLSTGRLFEARAQGIGRFYIDKPRWSAFVRVSRRNYTGRSRYRFLEEGEDA